MHSITLLQNTPVYMIKQFCESQNMRLHIKDDGELVLVSEPALTEEKCSVEMVKLTLSGFQEILQLLSMKAANFTYEITKATDGTDIILVRNSNGASRMFNLDIFTEER